MTILFRDLLTFNYVSNKIEVWGARTKKYMEVLADARRALKNITNTVFPRIVSAETIRGNTVFVIFLSARLASASTSIYFLVRAPQTSILLLT